MVLSNNHFSEVIILENISRKNTLQYNYKNHAQWSTFTLAGKTHFYRALQFHIYFIAGLLVIC